MNVFFYSQANQQSSYNVSDLVTIKTCFKTVIRSVYEMFQSEARNNQEADVILNFNFNLTPTVNCLSLCGK